MRRRGVITTIAMVVVSGCTALREEQRSNTSKNGSSPTTPQQSTLKIVSVNDSPNFPEEYNTTPIGVEGTTIIEQSESNQIFINRQVLLPNPNYTYTRNVSITDENDITINYTAKDTSPPNVAAPSVIQPTPDAVSITLSTFRPNTTIKINTISDKTITHEISKNRKKKEYNYE
jgi:hypothetical protein